MLRTVLAVIAGYLTMAVFIFATFSGAYMAMGTEGAFRPGSLEVSGLWIGTSIVLGFIAALVGGLVAAKIDPGKRGVMALAVLVLALGLAMAVPALLEARTSDDLVRGGDVGTMEAMSNAEQPLWITLFNPFLGFMGVMLAGRLTGRVG